jgi:hypothetical protein
LWLPAAGPKGAADELERTVTELGFKRSMVSSLTNGIVADDKRCWPMSGVFDTYPRLKIIIGHLGEGLSSTSGASAAGSAAVTAASRSATSSASTLGHDQWVLRSLALVLGDGDADRLDPVLRRLSLRRQSACGEMDGNSAIICRGRGELLSGKAKPLLKL